MWEWCLNLNLRNDASSYFSSFWPDGEVLAGGTGEPDLCLTQHQPMIMQYSAAWTSGASPVMMNRTLHIINILDSLCATTEMHLLTFYQMPPTWDLVWYWSNSWFLCSALLLSVLQAEYEKGHSHWTDALGDEVSHHHQSVYYEAWLCIWVTSRIDKCAMTWHVSKYIRWVQGMQMEGQAAGLLHRFTEFSSVSYGHLTQQSTSISCLFACWPKSMVYAWFQLSDSCSLKQQWHFSSQKSSTTQGCNAGCSLLTQHCTTRPACFLPSSKKSYLVILMKCLFCDIQRIIFLHKWGKLMFHVAIMPMTCQTATRTDFHKYIWLLSIKFW